MSNLKFIQAQSFSLSASGASLGDTSITLQTFKQIDGVTNIITSDLGSNCYATLEPNNGTQEEAIVFTGVTQNTNGTATLTGVSSVGFVSPYTVTPGLSKSHAGGVTFILSNDAAFYGNIKTYVDTVVASGAPLADNTTAGISKLSVSPATGANPVAVGNNDPRILSVTERNYVSSIVPAAIPYALATGTVNTYTATLASSVSTLASGTYLNVLFPSTNGTAATLNVNSLGAKSIVKNVATTLASADILKGQIVTLAYDGTNFQLMNPSANNFLGLVNSGQTSHAVNSATTTTIAHGIGVIPKLVSMRFIAAQNTGFYMTDLAYSNGTTKTISAFFQNTNLANNTNFTVFDDFAGGNLQGSFSVDATNLTVSWTKNGSTGSTFSLNILWDVLA